MRRRLNGARSIALDVSPLRESVPYRALWAGQVVSVIGTQMRHVAVAWQVFQLTRSTVAVGVIGLVEVVPLIVFSIIGGAIADAMDRRALSFRTQLGLMATSLGLAAVSLSAEPSVVWIYALSGAAAALSGMDHPARSAMIPRLVAPGKLPAAIALRQVVFQVGAIVGPALGGFIVASVDIVWVYVIDALTFVAALVSLRWVPESRPIVDEPRSRTGFASIREGLRFAFKTPLILSAFVIDLVAMIFGMPRAVFPALAERTFRMGAEGLGLLWASLSAGALAGALTTGWVGSVRRQGAAVVLAVAVWGAAITLAGLSVWSLWLTLLFLAVAGAADVVSAVFRGTMIQENTPDSLRGRVSALNIMVVTGGPRLGDFEAGLVAGVVGAPGSIVVGGLACLAGTGVVAAAFPSLRGYRVEPSRDRVAT